MSAATLHAETAAAVFQSPSNRVKCSDQKDRDATAALQTGFNPLVIGSSVLMCGEI